MPELKDPPPPPPPPPPCDVQRLFLAGPNPTQKICLPEIAGLSAVTLPSLLSAPVFPIATVIFVTPNRFLYEGFLDSASSSPLSESSLSANISVSLPFLFLAKAAAVASS